MKKARLKALAKKLQEKGRGTDTILAHINPWEAALLDRVTNGGTFNPHTGLLEFEDAGEGHGGYGNDNDHDGNRDSGPGGDIGGDRGDSGSNGPDGSVTDDADAYGGAFGGGPDPRDPGPGDSGTDLQRGFDIDEAQEAARFTDPGAPGPNNDSTGFNPMGNPELGGNFGRMAAQNAIENVYGGGFMGSLGRGIEGLLGFGRSLANTPEGILGVQHSFNPGILGGISPVPGGSFIGQKLYDWSGLPKPNFTTALQDPTKVPEQQVASIPDTFDPGYPTIGRNTDPFFEQATGIPTPSLDPAPALEGFKMPTKDWGVLSFDPSINQFRYSGA